MIGSINHIAIAVPDIRAAMAQWQERVGAEISEIQTLPEHGVHVAFIKAENGKVELLEPIDEKSPIAKFLEKMLMAVCIISVSMWKTLSRHAIS